MLTGPGCLNGRVQGQQIGLTGNLLDDGDLGGNLLHGRHGFRHRLAALFGIRRTLDSYLLRLHGVIGILTDVGGHLFHARRYLFGTGSLFGRPLRHILSGGRHLLRAGGDIVGRTLDLHDNFFQFVHHTC